MTQRGRLRVLVAIYGLVAAGGVLLVLSWPRDGLPLRADPTTAVRGLGVAVCVLFIAGLAGWLLVLRKLRRRRADWLDLPLCRRCGYDCRTSPRRCPECGLDIPCSERV